MAPLPPFFGEKGCHVRDQGTPPFFSSKVRPPRESPFPLKFSSLLLPAAAVFASTTEGTVSFSSSVRAYHRTRPRPRPSSFLPQEDSNFEPNLCYLLTLSGPPIKFVDSCQYHDLPPRSLRPEKVFLFFPSSDGSQFLPT